MNLRANPESKFLLKYLVIGLGCVAFAGWSLYDGLVVAPNKIPRAQAWAELQEENLTSDEENKKWKEISTENGWSSKRPSKDESVESIQHFITYQYIFIVLGLGIGLPCLIWYFRTRTSWIESTVDGLRSSSGQELKLSQIQKFDKKKWEKKGIGVIHYKTDDDSVKTFIVDDLKYDRIATDDIVRWVESNIPAEMIVNGEPELDPVSESADQTTAESNDQAG